jgi:glycosyltransferase-like protein
VRIALLTYSTRPRGGVVHTLALAEALARLPGLDVHVWTLARGGDTGFFRPVKPSVTVHAVPFPDLGDEVGPRILRSIDTLGGAFRAARTSYDVVHAQDCITANAAMRSGPCVRTIHHLDAFTTPELVACHERAVVAPAARICVSRAVADEVAAGWGLVPTVIANGVDAERFAGGTADDVGRGRWRDRLGRYVLSLGGIEPRKGTLDLLEAYALLRQRRPDVGFVLAGGETLFDYRDYRAAFDRRAAELGVEPQLLGVVAHDELPSLVAEASALGFVSTQEGFGLAPLEALAAGVPVVARDLPVLREVLGEHVTYARTPLAIADALERGLDAPPDPDGGRAHARGFSWDRCAAEHLAFYDSVGGRPASRRGA